MKEHIEEKKDLNASSIWIAFSARPRLFLTTNSYELYKIKYTKGRVFCKLLAWVDLPWISRRDI